MVTTGAGVDLGDLAVDVELGALLDEDLGLFAQSLFADDGDVLRAVQQRGGRQLVAAYGLHGLRDGLQVLVGTLAEGDRLGAAGEGLHDIFGTGRARHFWERGRGGGSIASGSGKKDSFS